ncbi:MAG: N-acetylglucosamine-6-phosphate deacetylase [Tepidisphaeraceae bacterium]
MPLTRLDHVRVLMSDGIATARSVSFDDSILAIEAAEAAGAGDAESMASEHRLLTAGLIDLHTHGIGHFAFERGANDLRAGLNLLPRFGVTSVLPTLYRRLSGESFGLLDQLAAVLEEPLDVRVPGFHLEGPFLALTGAGALQCKADIGFLNELLAACRGRVAAMSISPEVDGIVPVIERLCERGIVPFITHTAATVDQTQAAIDAGARHATHFYDVFPVPPETEPGVRPVGAVEALLGDPRVTVDFICDGVHAHPAAIRAALAAKGSTGVIAITDANVGAGLGPGTYDTPMGFAVSIKPGDAARIADPSHPAHGGLAGSSLTMDRAVENLQKWFHATALVPWQMATANPARVLGLVDRGEIAAGQSADLVLWDRHHRVERVWVAGSCVFSRERAEKCHGIFDS